MAGSHNIVVTKGDTFNFNFRVETDGVAWDLSTYTAKMQVRRSSTDTTKLLDLATGSGITMTSAGHVNVVASSATMSELPTGRWLYDFEVTSSGSEKTTLLAGRFIVKAEVTV